MSSKDFEHVVCPQCGRKLVLINISTQSDLLGVVFAYCPTHYSVFTTESIFEDDPSVAKANFRKDIPISVDATFETYQTLSLCIEQLTQFIDAAWEMRSMTNSAYHLLFTFKRHLAVVNEMLKLRMDRLNEYQMEE